MRLTIMIECDNDAFKADGRPDADTAGREAAWILRELAAHFYTGIHDRAILDSNGNRVGSVTVTP